LAHGRGFSGAEELATKAAKVYPEVRSGCRVSTRRILEEPPALYGEALDKVLQLTEEERIRLVWGPPICCRVYGEVCDNKGSNTSNYGLQR
jgi:hypothetical protein